MTARNGKQDYVYFAEDTETGLIKVGFSSHPHERIKKIARSSGRPLRILATIRGGLREEQAIHVAIWPTRVNYEWFAPSPLLSALIDRANRGEWVPAIAPPPVPRLTWTPDAAAYWGEWASLLGAPR